MPPAARVTDMHTCPMVTVLVPHVGGPILPPGQPTVLINFLPAATVTNMLTCVGPPDIIVKGSAGVFIGMLPAARMGDLTAHGGVIILGSPNVIIGEIGSPSPGAGGLGGIVAGLVAAAPADNPSAWVSQFSKPGASGAAGGGPPAVLHTLSGVIPKNCLSAPETIHIPAGVNKTMGDLVKQSFPHGRSRERGGIIVADDKGNLSIINTAVKDDDTSGAFTPDRNLPDGYTEVGLFHTHPYDHTEHPFDPDGPGGPTGVSLSGADVVLAANGPEPSYVQSGDRQFLMLPTEETPKDLDYDTVNDAQNARIAALVHEGKTVPQASRIAANETAQKYGMAYYQGKNGVLSRVSC